MIKINGACKDCEHWGIYREGVCDFIDTTANKGSDSFKIEVFVHDDSGLDTFLVTSPDFGCVHCSVKPTKIRGNKNEEGMV